MKELQKYIIKGKSIGFISTLPEEVKDIISAEKENYPYVSCNSGAEHLTLIESPDSLHMTIRKTDDYQKVGHIILCGANDKNGTLEFKRLVIYKKDSGFGRETIQLLKELTFEKLRMHRLWLDVFEDNKRAISLYESEGFVREGFFRDSIRSPDGYRSQYIYSLLEPEYRAAKLK